MEGVLAVNIDNITIAGNPFKIFHLFYLVNAI